jgi:hypothetical protein
MGDRHLQNSDPAKSRLQRLIQDIAHLVLDYHTSRMLALRIPSREGEHGTTILSSDQRIDQISPIETFERYNLPTCSTTIWFQVECLPQMID